MLYDDDSDWYDSEADKAEEYAEACLHTDYTASLWAQGCHHNAARLTLMAYGLTALYGQLTSSADGWAILAHLCNAGAKFIDPMLYVEKPILVAYAAEIHPFAWKRGDVVYIETAVGQVSFHVFVEQEHFFTYIDERSKLTGPWAGGWMQNAAEDLCMLMLGLVTPLNEMRIERFLAWAQPTYKENRDD